ncbi:hypothetical protein HRR83_003275 [Exophiala dermatitidis]|uniref:Ino eighty subunit 1 n=1 Tax=Exophiala dermatitidis TaxID=5970 RepID=A0AAN6EYC2_EXODE|nr:hypothetical protein HRR75_004177 [Exophiala dermatitidis]KAJ4518272.1 hypothetical protein HRR74_004567 [Exophiala dermatitidis]KAJ4521170.1 hypothetical protein HRR73_003511 [Exophiala dermatitidis]KAJ4547759.1 hypothetical protein HRR76_000385 [Exophiala dermatitidis]KAJ4553696.1 hypothetical protein HRR77_002073 [Exophiala dermatitidis]
MTSRDPSAAPSPAPSDGDTIDDQAEDVKPDITELDPDQSQSMDEPAPSRTPVVGRRGGRTRPSTGRKAKPKGGAIWIQEQPQEGTEDEGSVISTTRTKKSEATPESEARTVGTTVGTRRQANGTVGSVYSGSKIRHIKKPDGTPLWRKEIQYEFLKIVTEDDKPVFTRISDGQKGCTFAEVYVDCMARSSKTSKVLKDRLQIDKQAAQNMAMICLLVNVGRMNTTLNFFPEMRAQLRTYHSIPSLQAYKSQKDYKSLQDAPRLKSILKGASEDTDEPRTIPALKAKPAPRTNPVNLIFVLSQYAPDVSETHFTDKVDFFDLAMRPTISSASRARAFLWLMWWYLESNFTKEDALNNPYGPGEYKEGEDPDDPYTVPQLVPKLVNISEEEGDAENADPPEEIAFAEKMTRERKRIMLEVANEPPLTMADPGNLDHKALKRLKKGAFADDESLISDADSRASPGFGRSPAPDALGQHGHVMTALGGQADSLDDDWEAVDPHPGRGRYKRVKGKNTPTRSKALRQSDGAKSLLRSGRNTGTPDTVERPRGTPQPSANGLTSHLGAHRVESGLGRAGELASGNSTTKSRARTGYQRELEDHRMKRVQWALRRRRRQALKEAQQLRERASFVLRAARRIVELPATYDSEEDEGHGCFGLGGLMGRKWYGDPQEDQLGGVPPGYEPDDCGEEAETWTKVLKRARNRLEVWDGDRDITELKRRIEQVNQRHEIVVEPIALPPTPVVANGTRKKPRKRPTPVRASNRGSGRIVKPARTSTSRDLNDEITQDLLAERSDEEMDDDDSVDMDEDANVEESDVNMD